MRIGLLFVVVLGVVGRGFSPAPRCEAGLKACATAGVGQPHSNPIVFDDVTARTGIEFVLENNPTPEKHLVETMAGGLAAFDYNGDERIDLFFTNGAALPSLEKKGEAQWNRLYRNDGGLRFTDVTKEAGVAGEGYAIGAAAADYDGDGDPDLFVAGVRRNLLYRNRGDGTFEEVSKAAGIAGDVWAVAGAWLDYDRDGRLDLFVVNYLQWTPEFNRYCGDEGRGIRVYCHPRYFEGLPNRLYRNRGDGTFEDVSRSSGIAAHVGKGMSAAVLDYDADGWLDVFVTNDAVPSFLFRNKGDGTFEEMGLLAGVSLPAHGRPVSAMGVDARDVDGDGRPEIAYTALAGETFPLFRNEDGMFQDATYQSGLGPLTVKASGWGIGFVDFDNDGWPDLFTANSHVNDRIREFEASAYEEPNRVFRNVGKGRFEDVSAGAGEEFAQSAAHRGAVFADLDGDGGVDVVTTALGRNPIVWRNVSPNRGHWVAVRLRGTTAPRDGIGASVSVGTPKVLVSTAGSYASSNPPVAHFGLGEKAGPVEVVVTWPGGKRQTVKVEKVDRVVEVEERE